MDELQPLHPHRLVHVVQAATSPLRVLGWEPVRLREGSNTILLAGCSRVDSAKV